MKIKPITTDAEHEEALAEIDRLMDRNPANGTAAADRLGVLATLVNVYEDIHRSSKNMVRASEDPAIVLAIPRFA